MLLVLIAAQVLGVANANLIAVALPSLSADLGASGTQQQWIIDAYVLVFASLLVAGGTLADRYGRRRALLAGLSVFALGSAACALAADPGQLIAARVVQGLGPPLILPASLAILTASYTDPRQRGRAIGYWGAGSGLGLAVGPLLGGVLVGAFSWEAAFAFNVPAAAALSVAVLALVPGERPAPARVRFDAGGALLITLAMAALVFGIIEGRDRGWTSAPVVGGFAAAVVLALSFVRAERRHPAPLVDLELARHRRFVIANGGGAAMMFALLGATVYVAIDLQAAGRTPFETGLQLLPLGIATSATAAVAGRQGRRGLMMVGGLACAACGALALAKLEAVWPGLSLLGIGAGVALPSMTATAVGAVPSERAGMASAIHNASRQLGGTLGVAVLGTIVLSPGGGLAAAMVTTAALLAVVSVVMARGVRTG